MLFALKFTQKSFYLTTATMGYHRLLNIPMLSQPLLNPSFYQGMVKIILVGTPILRVKTAIIVSTSINLVETAIGVSTGMNHRSYQIAVSTTTYIYRRMANFSVCFIFPFFPECYRTGIINKGQIYTVHVRT